MDFFFAKDIELNANEGFWQIEARHKQINQPFLFGGNLLQANSQGVMSSTYYMLTCNYLISCKGPTKSLNKRSNINWKRLQPATLEYPPTVYRGFKLSTQTCSETFYAESLQEYDVWLSSLSKLCILGTLEEDYEMLSEIGRGSFSVVMKAIDRRSKAFVAIKLVEKNTIGAEQCLKEVSLMRRMSHESILQVLRVYDSPDQVAIILEYVEGGSLFDYIMTHKRASEEDTRVLMTKLLGGLEYCHSKRCVHRDLKLENILLARQDDLSSIKIADFGLAADLEIELLGKRCGSAGYVAPEILLDWPQTEKVDVFSAGVILYMCLSGLAPFSGPDVKTTLRRNSNCAVDVESDYWAHISSQAKDLVLRMMSKKPLKRLSTREAISHIWLTRLQKLPPITSKIELQKGSIAQSPRMEESKTNYLSELGGREASEQTTEDSPLTSPPRPCPIKVFIRRKSLQGTSESLTPTSPLKVEGSSHKFSDQASRVRASVSPNLGQSSIKSKTIKFRQRPCNLLEVLKV
jgi:serine/threonine protein kinase